LKYCGQALARIEAFLQLGVGDVARDDERAAEQTRVVTGYFASSARMSGIGRLRSMRTMLSSFQRATRRE
jgi:hypothetical protein